MVQILVEMDQITLLDRCIDDLIMCKCVLCVFAVLNVNMVIIVSFLCVDDVTCVLLKWHNFSAIG